MLRAFIFPGQGSQQVGMGKSLAEALPTARLVFEEIDDALSDNLSRIMFEGPDDTLRLTENAQPALMAVSMAIMRCLEVDGRRDIAHDASFVAGHSLGEYSALAAVKTIGLADAARLLRRRGAAMQRAVPVGVGAMAALLGVDLPIVAEILAEARDGEICDIANDNAPGQIVISGHRSAVDRAIEIAKTRGVRRAISLPVSAPFHCQLLAPAAEEMRRALDETEFSVPLIPVVTNVSAKGETDPERLKALLVAQVTEMVRWRDCVQFMMDRDIDTLVEVGSGKVLTGLAKRINRELETQNIETPEDIERLLKQL